eukprot:SM005700S18587  [mRNA]  locus=s5700:18:929:+ [translate_table: standard]
MRLAVSLQRSLAFAGDVFPPASYSDLHLLTRALAAASGSGQGTHFQDPSLSDLRLLSRVDVHGAFGAKWLDWLHRLAQQAAARRHGQQGEQPGFNVAGSLAQVFRMRLAVSLQR